MSADVSFRPARPDDHDAVRDLCAHIWPDRDTEYLPDVYPDWIVGDEKRTIAAEVDGRLVGIAQCTMLSDREAWCQGMRVHPDARGRGIGIQLIERLFDWARDHGALVARNMVFSWNTAGMGHSRAVGFEPATSFRWAFPEPAEADDYAVVQRRPEAAWQAWVDSDARTWLGGLAADVSESWALSECTERTVRVAASDGGALAVVANGLRGMAIRGREYEPPADGDGDVGQEYAAAAWTDKEAARTLFTAISADAEARGASDLRVLIPETPRHVSDVTAAEVSIGDAPHFVFARDLLRDAD